MTDHVHCLIYLRLKNDGLLYQVLIIVTVFSYSLAMDRSIHWLSIVMSVIGIPVK